MLGRKSQHVCDANFDAAAGSKVQRDCRRTPILSSTCWIARDSCASCLVDQSAGHAVKSSTRRQSAADGLRRRLSH
jgi:hypothetical protein